MREITYGAAIREATDQCLASYPDVYLMGLGSTDPKAIFGTTAGLVEKYGDRRVMDIPTSENGITGIAIGSTLAGMRPIITHQRIDFALLSLDQIFNNAAKWRYMFGGRMNMPVVIRMIIGRGWGQGPQHSQSLQSMFAHFPGLKVVMPSTPHDAKGLFISSVEDPNPVIFLEHRWLHGVRGPVPEIMYRVPLGEARTAREGKDVTIVSTSYMTLESIRAAEILAKDGIQAEVIDVRTLKPLDRPRILDSIRKTGRLIAADGGWKTLGFATEIVALAAEELHGDLKCAPVRIAFPDVPTPTTPALAKHFYPKTIDLINAARKMMGRPESTEELLGIHSGHPADVPDPAFSGPF